jgi:23S rRNA (adenine2503-C2)-methyltransferase
MQIEKKKTYEQYLRLLRDFFVTHGDKAFRESGIRMAMEQGAHSFEDMTNISKSTCDVRKQLRHQPH